MVREKIFPLRYILHVHPISHFFFRNKHTQGRGKWVLTQRHITTLLKSHDNFKKMVGQVILRIIHTLLN